MSKVKNILFIIAILVLLNIFTRGPDFLKQINCPPDKWFTGQASWFDPWDLNVYFSAIGWGRRDGLLFDNLYDSSSSQSMLVFPLYTLLGKLANSFNFSNSLVFHLGGFVFSLLLAGAVLWTTKIFLDQETERRIAFSIIFVGGGLGWLFFNETVLPDLGTPGFTLATALRMPREALSLSLFLLALGSYWRGVICQRRDFNILAGFFSFLMMLFHPYNLISLGIIFLSFGLYKWLKTNSFNFLKALFLLVVVGITYYFLIGRQLLSNPSFSGQVAQNQPSPHPVKMILGWGFLFPLIIMAIFSKKRDKRTNFLKAWFVGQCLILYLPIHFQKLLIRGLWIPAVILAVKGVRELAQRINLSFSLVAGLLLILTSFSTLFMTYKRVVEPAGNRWIYLTKEEGKIIEYLKTHGQDEEGVLASYRIANIIPAYTSKRVYAGHAFQTPNFEERMREISNFYSGKMKESEAKSFLEKANVQWIFWGSDEKSMSGVEKIAVEDLAKLVIEEGKAALYRVEID